MSDFGVKISNLKNVAIAGLDDLLLTSKYPCLKIAKEGEGSIDYTNDAGSVDQLVFEHNLGYQPLFFFQGQIYDVNTATKISDYFLLPYADVLAGGAVNSNFFPYATNTQLRYLVNSFDGFGGSYNLKYKYLIYYDPDK